MFDAVRNNKKIIQIVLALIILPFAFWGVDSLVPSSSGGDVATVGGSGISQGEFQQSLREQQERLRPMLGGNANPAMLDNPELRRAVVDTMVNQRLLTLNARKAKLTVSDAQLAEFIASVPQLQDNGKFSKERYEAVVASQGMSKEMFEARLRQDLAMQQAMAAVSDAAVPGRAMAERWVAAQLEEREIAEAILRPEQYMAHVKLGADAVKTYYEANKKQFETPEQVKVEFVALNLEKLTEQVTISDEDVKKAYQAQIDSYKQPETRRASHILITAAKGDSDAEAKAKAKADGLLAQLRKAPGDFEKLASQNSQDPGSASKGGDLDWFGRGMMVKPFEDSVFGLKEGEISDLVRSDFGFHIIKLTGVRVERAKAFDEVKGEIAAELKRQAGMRKYAESAEGFTNTVYEQPDSLKPVIEKYKVTLRQSEWIVKNGAAVPPFTNAKLMAALFTDDALKNKRNTEAIEVAPNTLVAARVVEHKPAMLPELETVRPTIETILVRQEAAKLAAKDGAEKLASLQKGASVNVAWGAARSVTRAHAPQLAAEAVAMIFKADAARLPAFAGTQLAGGAFALYRIGTVKQFAANAAAEVPAARALWQKYAETVAEQELMAWIDALKTRHEVTINKALLEAREK
ncbi:MAG: SurA N-terminal domain-containing protein [Gammaproteobacteria bacterium]|nr:SurA N-terminal domain-containing protein [Gammaproteobacteria bacterium]MBU1647326.1 SurA N-terminal domain-containing protein [Gammaproteobacteria bacterium]MBU1973118.1 SurA N-terminal domain-containing protein [Gammaproteobacteria bacterium]